MHRPVSTSHPLPARIPAAEQEEGRRQEELGIGLTSVPASWIDHTHLTHVSLDHNQLLKVPVPLFQLPQLYRLNLAHNCLEALPDILTWNCPHLKDLNVSHNRLQSRPFVILEGRRPAREASVDAHPPSNAKQRNVVNAAQAVINLTGHNLYPCIYSLARVNISHNATLEQVGGARRCGCAGDKKNLADSKI